MVVIACKQRLWAVETSVDPIIVKKSLVVGSKLTYCDPDLSKYVLASSKELQLHLLAQASITQQKLNKSVCYLLQNNYQTSKYKKLTLKKPSLKRCFGGHAFGQFEVEICSRDSCNQAVHAEAKVEANAGDEVVAEREGDVEVEPDDMD